MDLFIAAASLNPHINLFVTRAALDVVSFPFHMTVLSPEGPLVLLGQRLRPSALQNGTVSEGDTEENPLQGSRYPLARR